VDLKERLQRLPGVGNIFIGGERRYAMRVWLDPLKMAAYGLTVGGFCRLGTRQMLEILEDVTKGEANIEDLRTLAELAKDIKEGSLCNLGKTAPNPILTTLRYFHDEYEAHINEKRCPARRCHHLMTYYILPEKCRKTCDACVGTCTVEAKHRSSVDYILLQLWLLSQITLHRIIFVPGIISPN